MPKTTVALIDGDIFAYMAASVAQVVSPFDKEKRVQGVDMEKAKCEINRLINDAADAVDATHVIVCLTDRGNEFRKKLWPAYKGNRKAPKPALLFAVLDFIKKEWMTYLKPQLEADDVMGILATGKNIKAMKGYDRRIIVSSDKDMLTIPGLVFNPEKPKRGIVEVSPLDADRRFILQALTGDSTDGYPGIPGLGPKSVYAKKILEAPTAEDAWLLLVEAGASKGMSYDEVLTQARLARILRFEDYDFNTNTPVLWTPPES